MKQKLIRFCAILMLPFLALLNCPFAAIGAQVGKITMEINHDPVEESAAGHRIPLETEIEDESGVHLARGYFKAAKTVEYSFVEFKDIGSDKFTAVIPAPASGVASIEYFILVKNKTNQIVKTQTYQVVIEDDNDPRVRNKNDDDEKFKKTKNNRIKVSSELAQTPTEILGFTDNIEIVNGSEAKLVAQSTVTASSGISTTAISTTTIVVASIAGAAVVGGGAVAASGGSDDDDSSVVTEQDIVGSWSCGVIFSEDGTWRDVWGAGTWMLSGNTLTLQETTSVNDNPLQTCIGDVSKNGDQMSWTFTCDDGDSGTCTK